MKQFKNEVLDLLRRFELVTILKLKAQEIEEYFPDKQFNMEVILSDARWFYAFGLPFNVKMKDIIKSVIEVDLYCLYEITMSVGINEVDDYMKFAYFIEMFEGHTSNGHFMKLYQNQR